MALTAKLSLNLTGTLTSSLDLGTPQDMLSYVRIHSLTSGTGANQGDMMFHDQRTLAASANEDLDLAGSLTNAFGVTQTFVRVWAVIVKADDDNTNDVQITRPASNGVPLFMAASDGIALPPGGLFVFHAGSDATDVVVTAGTGDLINIANSAGSTSVTYEIVVLGASA